MNANNLGDLVWYIFPGCIMKTLNVLGHVHAALSAHSVQAVSAAYEKKLMLCIRDIIPMR